MRSFEELEEGCAKALKKENVNSKKMYFFIWNNCKMDD